MRKRDLIFLLAMVAVNASLFWFEPEVKTPASALGFGVFAVGLTYIVLKYVVRRRDYD